MNSASWIGPRLKKGMVLKELAKGFAGAHEVARSECANLKWRDCEKVALNVALISSLHWGGKETLQVARDSEGYAVGVCRRSQILSIDFPDKAVVCGPETVLVEYQDPGVALARAVVAGAQSHVQRYGQAPKMIVMRNHGLIVCGGDAAECERISAMAVKAARIRAGALASGGLHTLAEGTSEHLLARPDEQYRQRQLAGG